MSMRIDPKSDFVRRHVGPGEGEIREMLDFLGYSEMEGLVTDTVPEAIRLDQDLNLPDATPEHLKDFVADPASGSRHNRGCAVDLTLFDLETGEPDIMPAGFDEMTPRSHSEYPGGTTRPPVRVPGGCREV